ncbi:hypothetical protein FZEAL_4617 [Fusarium zealandicum]|uniref:Uncharacterized protein n=1 Tax=Fusarium zealandicum TaxID=1053134 RepID=A0A8H4XLE3_9HYPO|nr:hypothetical protein FZEAL_4617 [Fusarium zealandicum]
MADRNRVPTVIERPLPNAVTYDLSTPGQVRITLPEASTWSSGLHWHETHDEYLKVVKGTVRVRLGDTTQTVTGTDYNQPEIKVARNMWHEWQRAIPGGEVVVIERTIPSDNEKALFFWNLNGVILNAPKMLNDSSSIVSRLPSSIQGPVLDFWVTFNLFVIFNSLDNLPVFLDAPSSLVNSSSRGQRLSKGVDWVATHIILSLASWLGWVFGVQPVQLRYTPDDAYAAWMSRKTGNKKKAA